MKRRTMKSADMRLLAEEFRDAGPKLPPDMLGAVILLNTARDAFIDLADQTDALAEQTDNLVARDALLASVRDKIVALQNDLHGRAKPSLDVDILASSLTGLLHELDTASPRLPPVAEVAKPRMTKPAWVAWRNTDRTEGRGFMEPFAVCTLEATAKRRAKGASTQGCDGDVTEVVLERDPTQASPYGFWYGPVCIDGGTEADGVAQTALNQKKAAQAAKDEALKAATAAGLTPEQIQALRA